MREISRQLETFVRLPNVDIPSARENVTEETRHEEIEKIAESVRKQWNLPPGPVDDVVLELERHGIVTTRFNVGHAQIDAFSVPFADRPIVVLGADKNLRDRSRFDAAHELGHLVMHSEHQAGSKAIETQAHQFAAAFLMPAGQIRDQLPARADWPELMRLKAYWQVSIAALLMRARTLGVMTEPAYVQAMKIMSTRGWRQNEPGVLGEPERPVLLPRALEVAASVGIPLSLLAQRAGLPEADVRSIIGAETDERPTVKL
ncbi:ImmA/IrrE family metallo-endopeptidase [Micromonospora sp. NPDC047467]|uniref:ImmA/IrrE family metallo-endopeptidase n=1 Tax=Micromonospora sp. NPDC047467 TaxID=3154814 RepID=UPI0033ECE444